jgi:drug/metabolite transporter (DMT)-like permease
LAVSVCMECRYGVAKLALESTTPLNLLALRFFSATVALLPFVLIFRPTWPNKRAFKDLLVVATFLQLGHFLCIYFGLSLGASAGVLALFAASQPVLIAIVASLVNPHVPPARIWAGLMVGLAGASWVIFVQGHFSDGALLGAVLGFVAVVSLSLGQVYDKRQRAQGHPLFVYVIQYAFASFVSVSVALYFEGYQTDWTPSMIGAISQVTSIMFLVPGIAALIAWLVVGKVMPVEAWPGIVLAAAGVLLVLYAPSKPANQQGEAP